MRGSNRRAGRAILEVADHEQEGKLFANPLFQNGHLQLRRSRWKPHKIAQRDSQLRHAGRCTEVHRDCPLTLCGTAVDRSARPSSLRRRIAQPPCRIEAGVQAGTGGNSTSQRRGESVSSRAVNPLIPFAASDSKRPMVLSAVVAIAMFANGLRAADRPLPEPQSIPAAGPEGQPVYAPQAILPGGLVLPLFPPDSPMLRSTWRMN